MLAQESTIYIRNLASATGVMNVNGVMDSDLIEIRTAPDNQQIRVRERTSETSREPIRVQSFINNIVFPKTLHQLYAIATKSGSFNVEDILQNEIVSWTAPRWAKSGDIVFFMHSAGSKAIITGLRTQLKKDRVTMPEEQYNLLMAWINRGLALYEKYGGKIFAVGRVCGSTEYDPGVLDIYHWRTKIYADIEVYVLSNPIDIAEFKSFIHISNRSAITGVFGKDYLHLREVISEKNRIPRFFAESEASPLILSKINDGNWMTLSNEYRRRFLLEIQFRGYYVDYLLREIGDRKTFFRECRCKKSGMNDSFVDNVILFAGKYLPVEIKLSLPAAVDITKQVLKYCYDDTVILDAKENRQVVGTQMHDGRVLIIDTDCVYVYKAEENEVHTIFELDKLKDKSDIALLKQSINVALSCATVR